MQQALTRQAGHIEPYVAQDIEEASDDIDAGNFNEKTFWNLPTYSTDWENDLSIDLTKNEAEFLRNQIIKNCPNSLFQYILENNIPIKKNSTFEKISTEIYNKVSETNRILIDLANQFSLLVFLGRIRYNLILTNQKNELVVEKWETNKQRIKEISSLNIDDIFNNLKGSLVYSISTELFLKKLQNFLLENKINEVDNLIRNREISLKGKARAKLEQSNKYNENDLKGLYSLDYRFNNPVKQLILDINDAIHENF